MNSHVQVLLCGPFTVSIRNLCLDKLRFLTWELMLHYSKRGFLDRRRGWVLRPPRDSYIHYLIPVLSTPRVVLSSSWPTLQNDYFRIIDSYIKLPCLKSIVLLHILGVPSTSYCFGTFLSTEVSIWVQTRCIVLTRSYCRCVLLQGGKLQLMKLKVVFRLTSGSWWGGP